MKIGCNMLYINISPTYITLTLNIVEIKFNFLRLNSSEEVCRQDFKVDNLSPPHHFSQTGKIFKF